MRREPKAAPSALDRRLALLISSGGDERIWPDPINRRNRYGVPAAPAPDELWFSSSTASPVSPRGWAAARAALERVTEPGGVGVATWFDQIRLRLLALYGAPAAEAVLAASGTETELVALSLALALAEGPLVNIVVAPAETGSGVPDAARGLHFLDRASLGGAVGKGERLAGWEAAHVALETIEIRQADGALRRAADVDQEAALRVERAVTSGAFALLHVLDASKTGRPGVSRSAAARIRARYPGRVLVAVDACQLRCPAAQVKRDLQDGFAVMVTGSKFAGGPAFCGALLLPQALADRLAHAADLGAAPLAPYSAALDWPQRLRRCAAPGLAHAANLGLGLRWAAALAEIEAYEAVPAAWRAAALAEFDRAVRGRVLADKALELVDPPGQPAAPGLVPIVHAGGGDARRAWLSMSRGEGGRRPCHLGQPVAVGERWALRVCASMPMVTEAAERGFGAIEAALDEAFDTWASVRR
ncbi:MAG TPA: hypothetical protein VHS81_08825 [Caulobacteraceae bacterium]|nr:hypothetical protein [Caulobacteraceae bacterium]